MFKEDWRTMLAVFARYDITVSTSVIINLVRVLKVAESTGRAGIGLEFGSMRRRLFHTSSETGQEGIGAN